MYKALRPQIEHFLHDLTVSRDRNTPTDRRSGQTLLTATNLSVCRPCIHPSRQRLEAVDPAVLGPV